MYTYVTAHNGCTNNKWRQDRQTESKNEIRKEAFGSYSFSFHFISILFHPHKFVVEIMVIRGKLWIYQSVYKILFMTQGMDDNVGRNNLIGYIIK